MAEEIVQLLCSVKKLERDRGVSELQKYVVCTDIEAINGLQNSLRRLLENSDSPWETKHGALLGTKVVIPHMKNTISQPVVQTSLDKLIIICLDLLTDYEVRVRLGAGEVLGTLCEFIGPQIYEKCKDKVLELIKTNLERNACDASSTTQLENFDIDHPTDGDEHKLQRRGSLDAAQIFHDTAGWKFLETSMKCLQAMVDGCGTCFKPWINQPLLDLLFRCTKHTNRFVRETCYYLLGSLVTCGALEDVTGCDISYNPFSAEYFGHQISQHLGLGLGDNWSQVRLASSDATRKFLLSFSEEEREVFYPELLPKMCLNRYYVADGVRIYSQETWRRIAKTEGRELVQKYINNVVDYYISQTKADNHAVREAACACIAELASKIKQDAVGPHVPRLLETLLTCFKDDSWPVRDAACLACGKFILCYPKESKCAMDFLYPLFFTNLKDCIPSVRQGASGALANVVKAYGQDAYEIVEDKIKEGLKSVKDQPSDSSKYDGMEKGLSSFSVVKKMRDNDMSLHTDKQMYSCGSLAPKMGRGGGCSDHKFRKLPEQWEMADGCIHLVAELAQIPEMSQCIYKLLPLIAEAVNYKHYTHHVCLLETLCKQLPNIGKGIGKRGFKSNLESFLDSIFYSLSCENALTSSAASQCLNQISNYLGPSILRARVEQYNPSYLHQLDANSHIAAF